MGSLTAFSTNIFDYDLFGTIVDGNIKIVFEQKALINSLKLWIASYQGDFIGGNTRGGYVRNAINKPLSSTDAEDVYHAIMIGLKKDFRPELEVVSLSVIPNVKKRKWDITLDAYSSALKERVFIQESLKEAS